MLAAVSAILTKVSYLEKRTMNDNMKPHEAMRQLMQILSDFDMNGDPQWPLRSMRDVCLDYMRALSARYGNMEPEVRAALVRLVVFEACKRHIWSLHTDTEGLRKYEAIWAFCNEIEMNESGICCEGRFFTSELRTSEIEKGYVACSAYRFLAERGDPVSKFEMQTILLENEPQVRARTSAIQAELLRVADEQREHEEAQMRERMDSQMSNSDEAPTQTMGPQNPEGPQHPESPKRGRSN